MIDEQAATESTQTRRGLVRRTLKDSALYLPASIAQGLGGIVATMVISKLSDPASFGNYTLGVNLVTALAMIAGQWMNESLIRLVPEYQNMGRKRELYGSLLYSLVAATAASAILTWLVLLLVRPHIEEQLYGYLAVAAGVFPLMVAFAAVRSWCRATGRSIWYSALIVWRVFGGILLGLLIFALWRAESISFLWGMALAWCVVAIIMLVRRSSVLLSILSPRNFSRSVVSEALRYSLPMQGIGISALILSIMDRYLIGGFLNVELVGIYALGYSIAQKGMELVTGSLFRAMQPIVFKAWANDGKSTTRTLIEQLSRYYALVAIPLAVGITILSREVVILFSSVEYAEGAQVIGLVCAAMIFLGYSRMFEVGFALSKRTMPLLAVYLVTTAFNIVVNVLAIPVYGYIAAAWSTLASYVMMMVMLAIWSHRTFPIRVFGIWIWKPVVASALMALVVLELRQLLGGSILAVMLESLIGTVVYFGLIIIIRGVSSSELRTLFKAIRRRIGRTR